jgi:hypothetical protein
VVGAIKRLGQQQHASSYHIEFRFKTFKKLILPVAEVVPLIVDEDTGVGAPTDKNDRNRMSRLLHRVPDSEQGVCLDSDDDDINVDLSNEEDCVKIIADADKFTWNQRNQGDFAFMFLILLMAR